MGDAAAEMLAKEMQAIVAADRWKGRDLSAAPPEKWSHLRPETQQFWIDTAARILAALPAAPAEDVRAGVLKEAEKALRDWQDSLNAQRMPETAVTIGMAADVVADLIPGAKP